MENFSVRELKRNSLKRFNSSYISYILIFLPVILIVGIQTKINHTYIQHLVVTHASFVNTVMSTSVRLLPVALVMGIVEAVVYIICLASSESTKKNEKPVDEVRGILGDFKLLAGVIGLIIVRAIVILLWSVLLIIPGIVKAIEYSQVLFIYYDANRTGQRISYLEAIRASRQLMKSNRFRYCYMVISFIGWIILMSLPEGIGTLFGLFVLPHLGITKINFYRYILGQQITV